MAFKKGPQRHPSTHLAPFVHLLPSYSHRFQGRYVHLKHISYEFFFAQFFGIFVHGRALREFNIWTNGPRAQWGRGLQLCLQMFIIFNKGEIFKGDRMLEKGWWLYASFAFRFVSTSWMAAEQVLVARQEGGIKFVDCPMILRLLQQGKI